MKKQTLFIKLKGTHGVFNYTCYNTSIVSTIIRQEGLISPKQKHHLVLQPQ